MRITFSGNGRCVILAEFLRYLITGGIAFLVDYSLLVFLTEVTRLYFLTSAAIAFCCGLVVNYELSVNWVFSTRAMSNRRMEFITFSIIGIVGLGWNELIMYIGTELLTIDYRLSKLASVAATLVWNFSIRKYVLFHGRTA